MVYHHIPYVLTMAIDGHIVWAQAIHFCTHPSSSETSTWIFQSTHIATFENQRLAHPT